MSLPDKNNELEPYLSRLEFLLPTFLLRCCICDKISLIYWKIPCSTGHTLCPKCIVNMPGTSGSTTPKQCPIDGMEFEHKMIVRNKYFENAVLKLPVRCPNSKFGCKAEILLENFINHYNACPYGYTEQLRRFKEELNSAKTSTAKFPHKLAEFVGAVKPISDPESKEQKLPQATIPSAALRLTKRWKLKTNSQYLASVTTIFEHKVTEISTKLVREDYIEECAAFSTQDGAHQMQAALHFSAGSIVVLLRFLQNDESKAQADVLHHKRTVLFLDSHNKSKKRNIIRSEEPGFSKSLGTSEFWMNHVDCFYPVPVALLKQQSNLYMKDDKLELRVVIEPNLPLCQLFQSKNGILVWKLSNYKETKQDEVEGVIECAKSEYFYSDQCGYRMQASLNLNQVEVNGTKFCSIYLDFLKCEFDDDLPMQFPHVTTVALVSQADPPRHIAKVYKNEGGNLYGDHFKQFARLSEIETPKYLVNNCLVIKVIVETF